MKKILCLFVLIILAFSAKSQYVPMTSAGYQFKGVLADTLMFATGCGAPVTTPGLTYRRSAIYYDTCGSKGFYVYDPPTFTWNLIGSGSGSFPLFMDTLYTTSDSTFRWCKGSNCYDELIRGGDFAFDCSGMGEQITNMLDIYHENVEWTTSVSGSEFNAASTNFPCSGSKSVEATTVGNNDFINFTAPSVPDYTAYNYLVFKISSKGTWASGRRLRFRWLNGSSAVGVGVNFTDGSYGFKSNITDSCQLIYIPLAAFGTITGANKLHVEGSITSSGTIGFYIDDIVLQQSNVSAVFGSAITWDQTMRNSPDISQDYFSHFNSTTWTMDSILQLKIHVQDWVDIIGDKDAGREYILKAHVNDNPNSIFFIGNSTGVNGAMHPMTGGYLDQNALNVEQGAYSVRGITHSTNDVLSTGTPVIQFVVVTSDNETDPNQAPLYAVHNQNVFGVGDSDLQYFMVKASGQLQLPMYVSGAFAGTAAYNLAVDASGNVIVIDTSVGGGGSPDRFGIEDITGVQNRDIDMGGFTFSMDNTDELFITTDIISNKQHSFDMYSGGTILTAHDNLVDETTQYIQQATNIELRYVPTGGTTTASLRVESSIIRANAPDIQLTGNLQIVNATAPVSSPLNAIQLYAEDVSSSSELKVRDEAGNITTLSPHNFSGIPEGRSNPMAWAYYSEKDGKYINVDMYKLADLVEKLSGEKLIYTGKVKDLK